VREAAAVALGDIKAKEAVKPLLAALEDEGWDVRWAAKNALKRIGQEAVQPLIAALKDKDKYIRQAAAKALGEIKVKEAVKPLIEVLKDENKYVRYAAEEALEKITGKDLGCLHDDWLKWWRKQKKK